MARKHGIPGWAQELEARIGAGSSPLYVLHLNVADHIPLGEDFLSLRTFVIRRLGHRNRILFYNRSSGLHFGDLETETLVRRATGLAPDQEVSPHSPEAQRRRALVALGEPPTPKEWPTQPARVL
ncbi:MAG: hypothetical protein ACM362_13360, partial [Candidatus Methylomirabilota bacterium]